MQEDKAKKSMLAALFNTLDEDDKDIVISLSESLTTKHKQNMTKNINNNENFIEIATDRLPLNEELK